MYYDTTITKTKGESEIVISEMEVRFLVTFIPGRPAYTPKGEYGPIDPPEPADVAIFGVRVKDWHNGDEYWRDATKEEAEDAIFWINSGDDRYQHMIDEIEKEYNVGPDPDRLYDERVDRELEDKFGE